MTEVRCQKSEDERLIGRRAHRAVFFIYFSTSCTLWLVKYPHRLSPPGLWPILVKNQAEPGFRTGPAQNRHRQGFGRPGEPRKNPCLPGDAAPEGVRHDVYDYPISPIDWSYK